MKLFFVRHGESEANVMNMMSNRGWIHGLTEKGKAQAAGLAQEIKHLPFKRVYASPLKRTVETAELLAEPLGLSVETHAGLREVDSGILEGKSDEESWKIFFKIFYDWFEDQNWDSKVEEGDSLNDLRARFLPALENILAENEDGDHILIVSHAGVLTTLLPFVLDNVGHKFSYENPLNNIDMIVAHKNGDGLICEKWGNVSAEKLRTAD
ncbi:MAG: histidine phosphatase family protein [Anaerolineaceae bacterium]|nr:histidine phosphatase family protein [Anaerolineaceae bacterium]